MKRQILVFFILAAFVFIDAKVSYAKWVWSSETSWTDPEQLPRETTDQRFRYAVTLLVNREYISAIDIFKDIIKNNPGSELAEESQLKIGKEYYMLGDYKNALIIGAENLSSFVLSSSSTSVGVFPARFSFLNK